jgi:hypothetical protein
LRNLTGMTYETYFNLSRFGFIAIILVLQIPGVRYVLSVLVGGTLDALIFCFHFPS